MFHFGESGESETHGGRREKRNLDVFVNHRERMLFEGVREREKEGETGDDREGEEETGGVCVHALS